MTLEQTIPNLSIFIFFVSCFWFLLLTVFLTRKQLILPFIVFVVLSIYLFISNSSYGRYKADMSDLPDDNYTIISINLSASGPVPMVLLPENSEYYRYFIVGMNQQQKEDLKEEIAKKSKGAGASDGNMKIVRKKSGWSVEMNDDYKVPDEYNQKNAK